MEQHNGTITSRRNKHLNRDERIQIEVLSRRGESAREIAEMLGRSERTIRRELKNGRVDHQCSRYRYEERYSSDRGQTMYEKRRYQPARNAPDTKLVEFLQLYIVEKRFSPDAAAAVMRQQGVAFAVCTKTIYNLIERGEIAGVGIESLWEKRKRKKECRVLHRERKRAVEPGHSITDRPAHVELREEFGHWEIDLVHLKEGALLTLNERKTRRVIIRKLKARTQAEVIRALRAIETQMGAGAFRNVFKSITADNGSEFLDYKAIEQNGRTRLYYAHPYSSWERGSNENVNRLIRRFIPKGSDGKKVSAQRIKEIEEWINAYPRKRLNYQTAEERYHQELAA